MSNEDLRVQIAKDVISRLNTGQIDPLPGVYFNLNGSEFVISALPEVLAQGLPCTACAVGAVFAACVSTQGGYDVTSPLIVRDSYERLYLDHFRTYLTQWFTQEQLQLIECYFEGKWVDSIDEDSDEPYKDQEQYDPAEEFVFRYPNPKVRLTKIMQNIIKNNGIFVEPMFL